MKNMKKIKWGLAGLCVMGLATIGGTMAYLTDYEAKKNEFVVGKVDIELQEPLWNPEDNTSIVPSQVIAKDPKIKNLGKNDAFVYLEVAIPMATVITADENGNRQQAQNLELFSFSKKDEWDLMEEKIKDGKKIYTYSYSEILEPGRTTQNLFDNVVFANIIEGQIDESTLDIPVRAYAIQTVNTGGGDSLDISVQARTAFQKYVNQNKGEKGSVMGNAE
ncbi:MAG: TasA family protein [Blautia sp.]|nr:TasA family protein [Blautia sp.]